ncbi:MAG: hypothetical protein CM1200mP18_20410 [Gammaproteobacteria bacterium]|nr:MAG: hypothetical protein CM1200mP18_20410 [Gammaproteobacteria bacterium]
MWSAFVRFLIATLCVLLWARYKRINIWPRKGYRSTLFMVGTYLRSKSRYEYWIQFNSGRVCIYSSVNKPALRGSVCPLMIAGDRLNFRRVIGFIVAFVGASLVLLKGNGVEGIDLIGVGGFVVLPVQRCWACGWY